MIFLLGADVQGGYQFRSTHAWQGRNRRPVHAQAQSWLVMTGQLFTLHVHSKRVMYNTCILCTCKLCILYTIKYTVALISLQLGNKLNLIVSILTKLIKNILVIYKHLSSWDKQQLQSVRRIFPVFLLLLILACAVPASSRAKVLSTGTFRDPLEKWGSTREENCRKKIKQQSLCLKLGRGL